LGFVYCYITIVSNPWREAIEEAERIVSETGKKFPILGGRLLKSYGGRRGKSLHVSNPWREAIEEDS